MNNKITLPEIIILLLITVPIDILEIFEDIGIAIPVIGPFLFFLNHILDWVSLFITQFYFIMKTGSIINRKILPNGIGDGIEFIPILDILPWRTVGLLWSIHLVNKGYSPTSTKKIKIKRLLNLIKK